MSLRADSSTANNSRNVANSAVPSAKPSSQMRSAQMKDTAPAVQGQAESKTRSWLDVHKATTDHVRLAARNCAWVGKTSNELGEAIEYVKTENAMMEEVLSEPHHIVSNNDLAQIMKSVLSSASDSKSSSIMKGRKAPVLRMATRARGEAVPPDRSGTEYLPFASSAVPYAALQQEQRDMIQRNKERQVAYDKLVLDCERQQQALQERWGKL